MSQRIFLIGDEDKAIAYSNYAKGKLRLMKEQMSRLKIPEMSATYQVDDILVTVSSSYGQDTLYISTEEKNLYFVAHVGKDTTEYNKKYYKLIGNSLQEVSQSDVEISISSSLIDDGMYYQFTPLVNTDDINDTVNYAYIREGLNIPATGAGISISTNINGFKRYILTEQIEQELFLPYGMYYGAIDEGNFLYKNGYQYLTLTFSLSYAYYGVYHYQNAFHRYTDKGVLYSPFKWKAVEKVAVLDGTYYYSFLDYMNNITNVFLKDYDSKIDTFELDSDTYLYNSFYKNYFFTNGDNTLNQVLIYKPSDYISTGFNNYGYWIPVNVKHIDPIERYSINFDTLYKSYNRCSSDSKYNCYLLNSMIMDFYDNCDGSGCRCDVTDYGFFGLNDTVIIPYTLTYDNNINYIKYEHSVEDIGDGNIISNYGNILQYKTGVYCRGNLVEESEWKSVIKLFEGNTTPEYKNNDINDTLIKGDGNLYTRSDIYPIRYQIVQTYNDENFDVMFYRKNELLSHNIISMEDIYVENNCGDAIEPQLVELKTKITNYIYVNGKIYDLNSSAILREYFFAWDDSNILNSGFSDRTHYIIPANIAPVINSGWDYSGVIIDPVEQENTQVIRTFISNNKNNLLFSYDIFPMLFYHSLKEKRFTDSYITYPNYYFFELEYPTELNEETGKEEPIFPPSTDYVYTKPKERKWLLFDRNGIKSEIESPVDKEEGTIYNRINGCSIL